MQGAWVMHPGIISPPGRTYLAAATMQSPEPSAARVDAMIQERLLAILPDSGMALKAMMENAVEQRVTEAM